MHELTFFPRGDGLTLSELATLTGASLGEGTDASLRITGIAALSEAGSQDLSLFDSTRYSAELAATRAGCVLVSPKNVRLLPSGMPALVTASAAIAFTQAGRALFPGAVLPTPATGSHGVSLKADIHREAKLEDGVTVEAFASIGPGVEIGRGTIVGAGSVIGAGCRIGRNCRIGSNVTLTHTLLGDRVILHPGVRIGQDGFGYTAGPTGLVKAVQIGRVIIQNDVEIGANTTVDRGGVRDTVIGEGTKIDNQVQIAHNVRIGRHCVIVAQVGISGSATLGDGVMIGGQTGVNGHLTIADGAQIAAVSSVAGDVPKGARWGGTPAKPVRDWFRELTTLSELAQRGRSPRKTDE